MNEAMSFKSTWLETFFFKLPCNIKDMEIGALNFLGNGKPKYFELSFVFYIVRTSESHYKMKVYRHGRTIEDGNYKFEFHCDINILDEEYKTFEMLCNKYSAEEEYVFKPSDRQNSSSDKLEKEFEIKILVRLIEYDDVQPLLLLSKAKQFRKKYDKVYDNDSFIRICCDILDISKLDDIFRGRIRKSSFNWKMPLIKRTVEMLLITGAISTFWKSRKESSTEPFEDMGRLPFILGYILQEIIIPISDPDLIKIFKEAHYLGLELLRHLSRDCILHRLKHHEKFDQPDYETFIFNVVEAAVHVNDDDLLVRASLIIFHSDNVFRKLKDSSIKSRFGLYTLQRILKEIAARKRTEEASTSRI